MIRSSKKLFIISHGVTNSFSGPNWKVHLSTLSQQPMSCWPYRWWQPHKFVCKCENCNLLPTTVSHNFCTNFCLLRMSRPLRMLTLKGGILLAISHRMILCTVILNGIFGLLIFVEKSCSEIGFLHTTGVLRHQWSQKNLKRPKKFLKVTPKAR